MTTDDADLDKYEDYAEQFDPLRTDRQARRQRELKTKHLPKKSPSQVIAEIAEPIGLEGEFKTTYQPARYEASWLLYSLRSLYDQDLISDVLTQVKGGKEANVYCCQAHPATGLTLLAAKIYRPRMFRNLRNDKMYREGRTILTADGRPVKKNDHRVMRAIGKKSTFGAQVQHTSWLMYEYTTLERLYQAGAAVPQPIAAAENAILMSYYGDSQMAAPPLNEVTLDSHEATHLFQEILGNVELMLQHELIHGDLSAYNILYWAGNITIIDFPQVVDCYTNPNAYLIFQRDIKRVCEYFARQGVLIVMTLSVSLTYTLDTDLKRRGYDLNLGFEEPQSQNRVLSMLRSVPGVAEAELWYTAPAAILKEGQRLKEAGIGAQIIAIPAGSDYYRPLMIAGRWFQPGDGRVIVISKDTADDNNIKVGDTVTLNLFDLGDAEWQVIGVFQVIFSDGFDTTPIYAWQFCQALYLADQNGWTRFVSMQNHYNLLYREEEREMMGLCQAEGIGVIPWSPLARGKLTRPWETEPSTLRAGTDKFGQALYSKTQDADRSVVERLGQIAEAKGLPRAQVALAWLLHKPAVTAPIIGASKPHHLEDAIGALSVTLSADEISQLEEPYQPHPVLGFE